MVADVMTTTVIAVDETTPVADIAELMETRRIKRVPVMRDGALVGIITRGNLIRALASTAAPAQAQDTPSADDREIADAIVAALSDKRWALSKGNVIVKDGVAHLWGVVPDEQLRRAFQVAAEQVPGVAAVDNHIHVVPRAMPAAGTR